MRVVTAEGNEEIRGINFYSCINEWIYLIARIGTGSWSFMGVQADLWGFEKPVFSGEDLFPSSVPGVVKG